MWSPLQPEALPGVEPEARLAAAVMRQALADARDAKLPAAHRQQARAFLIGREALATWATIAGLNVERVARTARRALSDHQHPAA